MRPYAELYCQHCGRPPAPGDFVCLGDGCGCTVFGPELPPGVVPLEETGGEVEGPLAGRWRLPFGKVSLWHGPPGAGKTTLALHSMPGATVIDLEQSGLLVAQLRQREGLPQGRTVRPTIVDGVLVDLGLGGDRPRELLFDSLTSAPDDLAAAEMLVDYCAMHGARAIAIVHETTTGTAWGGNAIPHLMHSRLRATVESTGRQVEIGKDRSGATGVIPWRMAVDRPLAKRYVSVEGKPGAYRLVEHPDSRASWAGPLQLAELGELELPAAPLAVAARPSWLYPSGWVEPGDVDDRRKYAEAQGCPFFVPPARQREVS